MISVSGRWICDRANPLHIGRYLGIADFDVSFRGEHYMKRRGRWGDYDWHDKFWFNEIYRELSLQEADAAGLL